MDTHFFMVISKLKTHKTTFDFSDVFFPGAAIGPSPGPGHRAECGHHESKV